MKDHSCQTSVLTFYEVMSCNPDRRRPVNVVYLDFAKAFDTVLHNLSIYKLWSVGIDDSVCTWIKKLVQRVVINGISPKMAGVVSGVSRGSVMGPILLNLFINDIEVIINSSISVYADDGKLSRVITL